MASANPVLNRSDYLAIYEAEGAEGLNRALAERLPVLEHRLAELERMERGAWIVQWDDVEGDGAIAGRKPPATP